MTASDIILSVLGSMGILALGGTAVGLVVKSLVEKGIQHKFDSALESYRSELRQEEDKLKSALAAEQSRIDALQRMVLSGMTSRNEAVDKRRLQAIERLWAAVVAMQPLRNA